MARINHIAVWVAGILHFMLGAAWYMTVGTAVMGGIIGGCKKRSPG